MRERLLRETDLSLDKYFIGYNGYNIYIIFIELGYNIYRAWI